MICFVAGVHFKSLGGLKCYLTNAVSRFFKEETGLRFGQYFNNRRQKGIGGLTAHTQQVTNQSVCTHRTNLDQVRCGDWLSYNRRRKSKSEWFYPSKRNLANNRRHRRLALSKADSSCSPGVFVNRSDCLERCHFDSHGKWACKNEFASVWTREFNSTETREKSPNFIRSASVFLGKKKAYELKTPEHSSLFGRVA